ncbi:hypothetical protein LEP1GSC016_4164 [Leptospira borgpetersenii serovar Hardjo-bovis str. Sponselee]|uniref:Uncharacterized protein n=1 Tax=Leptospira borgpetersenii serovar Hardjo-bovis str. Sponselee TaxID=1303729 RepID=M6BVM9_LEPBO|nr:hypothetical protein LEP1GSC016_4164 [Leptospira borgpetersenii serovar Hardjo-bovis str. Sponselee]
MQNFDRFSKSFSQNFDRNIIANFSQNEEAPTDWLFICFRID